MTEWGRGRIPSVKVSIALNAGFSKVKNLRFEDQIKAYSYSFRWVVLARYVHFGDAYTQGEKSDDDQKTYLLTLRNASHIQCARPKTFFLT